MNLLGISRSACFSPNSVDRDTAIFSAVSSRLLRRGHNVSVISEDLFVAADLSEFDLVFSMARGKEVLHELADAENGNRLVVINSAKALLENTRSCLVAKFSACGIPQPATRVLCAPFSKDEDGCQTLHFPVWLKRSDACAQSRDDVRYVSSPGELPDALADYEKKGVKELVAVEHAEGDLVKFYGVEGVGFFSYTYPTEEQGYSKFGLEAHNGKPKYFSFSSGALKQMADKAARESGFLIYGGDAIIMQNGDFVIIDFNDWPSFASCRKQASKAIAQRIIMAAAGRESI